MMIRTAAKVSFWVFVFTMLAGYFLAVMVTVIPPTNPTAAAMLTAVVVCLIPIGDFALAVLLYSLVSLLGVFDKAKQ